jgi:hypothetical protein
MTEEEWLPVREFPDHYEVSSLGRVRNIGTYHRKFTGKIRKPHIARNGYPMYCLSVKSKYRQRLAHRLVADAFLGPIPEGMQVNHKDGDKSNCKLDNLEIVTNGENRAHSYRVLGVKPNGQKVTPEQRDEIRDIYSAGGVFQSDLADKFGVSQQLISKILRGYTPRSKRKLSLMQGPTWQRNH